ncbi:MAG: SDR family NAD(P)-dependent oxidoreductase [Candidatus Aminicenantes bacterium]|nr:SDR family NAD(P)-dependent oxidoreductase [Candidatus Aminicenantes bacterium]
MRKIDFKDRWVVITGASSGLGREMALIMAKQEKAKLIIAARRKRNLEQLKKEIETSSGTRVEAVEVDLSISRNVEQLFEKATEIGNIYALINNAGLTAYGKSDKKDLNTYEKMLQVNFMAAMKLSLLFISHFQKHGEGIILNITSQSAFVPIPYQNIYSASKSALQSFSDGLREEYRYSGIVICSYAPGGIDTEMVSSSGIADNISPNPFFMMNPHKASIKAIRALKKGKALEIPSFIYKLNHLLTHFLPRRWMVYVAAKIYKPKQSSAEISGKK